MSNSPKGCPICGCTEYGFAAFPVCWLCGYAQEKDGRVVYPCGKSEEVVAALKASLAERDVLLRRVQLYVNAHRQSDSTANDIHRHITTLLGEEDKMVPWDDGKRLIELTISADVKLLCPQPHNNEIDELDASALDPQAFYTPTPLLDVDDFTLRGEEAPE